MKDRIRQLMLDKGMSQKAFASELCIAEATLSGIFNGRTRPTNLTVNAIHERFPDVNISWLMFGEGEMYVDSLQDQSTGDGSSVEAQAQNVEPDFFSTMSARAFKHDACEQIPETNTAMAQRVQGTPSGFSGSGIASVSPQVQYIEKYVDRPQRRITEIRIFFDDGTYETFTP